VLNHGVAGVLVYHLEVVGDLLEVVAAERLRHCSLLLHLVHLFVELLVVVHFELVLDGAQDSREGLFVKLEELALIRLHPNAQRSLLLFNEGQLSKVISRIEAPHEHETTLVAHLVELQAVDVTLFDDEELLALVSLLEHELVLVKINMLQSVDQPQLLELVEGIKELDLVEEACLHLPLLHARVHDHLLEEYSVQCVGHALALGHDGRRSLVIIQESELSETASLVNHLVDSDLLVDEWVGWVSARLINEQIGLSASHNVKVLADVAVLDNDLSGLEGFGLHGRGDLVDFLG